MPSIHYEVEGSGPPIVFVHGLGADSSAWRHQRAAFRDRRRVIVYDRSGCGRSGKSDSYSVEAWADELAGLLDELAIPSAVVVGHSLGSMVAMRFAAKYPGRTRALVLAGGEACLDAAGKRILTERADEVEAAGLAAVVERWLAGVLAPSTLHGNPSLVEALRRMFLANDPHCYAAHCRALRDGDVRGGLPNIACPTLLTVGDQDRVSPPAWQREIAAAIPNSRVTVVPDTGHMTMLEHPGAFNTILTEFLTTLAR